MRVQNASGSESTYYYRKNLQGDVVAVLTEDGYEIRTYVYDAWGRIRATDFVGISANVTAEDLENARLNPIRYRGYYYDAENELYYLQSRYYSPAWGRFINADGYINANGDLLGYNMFAYCSNNPVMYSDYSGEGILLVSAILILGFVAGAVIAGLSAYADGKSTETIVKEAVLGGAVGLVIAGAGIMLGAIGVGIASVVSGTAGMATAAQVAFLGTTVAKGFALGALAFNFTAYIVAPLAGVKMQGVEYENYSTPDPTPPQIPVWTP